MSRSGLFTSSGLQTPARISVQGNDARSDLGYGTTNPKFFLPRSLGSVYPYVEPDPYEDEEEPDEEDVEALRKKSTGYVATDSLAGNGTDPFYFVGGNTKLSDCFWRTDDVLEEIAALGDSMASIPQMYKGKGASLTGYEAAFPYQGAGGTNYRRTGSLQGWSKSPPLSKAASEDDFNDSEDYEEEDPIYTLVDLAKKNIEKGLAF